MSTQWQSEWMPSGPPTRWPTIISTSKCKFNDNNPKFCLDRRVNFVCHPADVSALLLGLRKGWCVDGSKMDIDQDVRDLGINFTEEECIAECNRNSFGFSTGCEYYKPDQKCTLHNSPLVDSGSGNESYICQLLSGKTVRPNFNLISWA